MITIVIALDITFLVVAFGVRTLVQWRSTGDSGWRVGRPDSAAEATARIAMVVGGVAMGVATATAEANTGLVAVLGLAVAVASVVLVSLSQLQMGTSWRIGVDHEEMTDLVSTGLFAVVRNPIYTGMATYAVAHLAMTPSPWAFGGAALMILGVQVQARLVEEPYLRAVHGAAFGEWAERVGRFVPGLGRSISAS